MRFSVVQFGYDQEQVDACLADLSEQLAQAQVQAQVQAQAVAETDAELTLVREEANRLRGLLAGRPAVYRTSSRLQQVLMAAEEEAAEILAQARDELSAAQREAEQVRAQAYADAVRARRDFELALHTRRQREQRVDEILRQVGIDESATASAPAG